MSADLKSFLTGWEREFAVTSRVLANFPPTSLGFRPHPKSQTAGELAWHQAKAENHFVSAYLKQALPHPEIPASLQGMLQAYAVQHQGLCGAVRQVGETAWTRTVPLFGQDLTGAQVLELMLRHAIHHRGQFSVYLRLVDAKVPAIYGPSADEKA